MMIQDNWQYNLFLDLQADEADDIASLLEEIAAGIRLGKHSGDGNHCAGVYTYMVESLPLGSATEKE